MDTASVHNRLRQTTIFIWTTEQSQLFWKIMFTVDLEYLNICNALCLYMYMNLGIYKLLLTYIYIYTCIHKFANT